MSDTRDPPRDESRDQDPDSGEVQTPHDALGAYALGALSIDEQRLFELHLFVCAACRADVEAYRRTTALLPYGLAPERPPAGARDRLLARARAEASESPTVAVPLTGGNESPTLVGAAPVGAVAPTLADAAPREAMNSTEGRPVPVEAVTATAVQPVPSGQGAGNGPPTVPVRGVQPRRGAQIKLASIGWGAALLIVIASGLFIWVWSTTGPHVSLEVQVLARLPGGQVTPLRGTGVPSASARLFVVESGRRAELAVDALPPLPPGRVYQLWFAEPGQPERTGGAFSVNQQGDAAIRMAVPTPLERVQALFITQEPAPGLTSPTGVHLLDWTP